MNTTRRITITGMLFAVAIAFSWLEAAVAPMLGLPPGVKLGLANIVVLYALLFTSRWQALMLVVLKAGFAMMTRGGTAGLLSGAGGLLSLGAMLLLLMVFKQPSITLLSVTGAIVHNLGQLAVVAFWIGTATVYYLPILLVSGVGMGVLTAVSLRALMPAFERMNFKRNF